MEIVSATRERASMASESDLSTPTYLRQWRKFRRLTQEQLAERVGVSPPAISQLENNKQGFTGESLARLANALDCTPAALLGYDPTQADSFWPLLKEAESLQGRDRQKIHAILRVALDQFRQ